MKRLKRLTSFREENGAVLVMVAFSMLALLGFTALAIDGGRIYSEKSKLQKAVDSAVLAGAQGLRTTNSSSSAEEIANDIFYEKYGYDNSLVFNLTVVPGQSIEGEAKNIPVSMTFAKAVGTDEAFINASAKAVVGPITKASGIAPFVILKSDIPNRTVLNCGSTNPGDLQGNCGYLKFSDGNLRDAILNGATYDVRNTVFTDPGGSVGQVEQAIDGVDGIVSKDVSKLHCQSPDTADNSCARVITTVVVDNWVDVEGKPITGKSEVKIVGFASYWIDRYEDKRLYGKFIKMVAPGEIGTGTGIGDYNLFGVKLSE
ncbi:pilus assembly protein TadG-related protein [Neobacillus drentensis]|jgi:hypothetical protein|uniref:pilus assembly protein TadG-related protein n=1 Tax=Neobacillus drentensis TaxID=220684 RepID=UPI002FFEE24D